MRATGTRWELPAIIAVAEVGKVNFEIQEV
jgi:hypothetical protein